MEPKDQEARTSGASRHAHRLFNKSLTQMKGFSLSALKSLPGDKLPKENIKRNSAHDNPRLNKLLILANAKAKDGLPAMLFLWIGVLS